MQHFLSNAKAYAALVGAVATALLGVYAADTQVGKVLTVVSVVAAAVVTWRVPNAGTSPQVVIGGDPAAVADGLNRSARAADEFGRRLDEKDAEKESE